MRPSNTSVFPGSAIKKYNLNVAATRGKRYLFPYQTHWEEMMSQTEKRFLAEIDKLIENGQFDEAAYLIGDIVAGVQADLPKQTMRRLQVLVDKSPVAAHILASITITSDIPKAINLYLKATSSQDDAIKATAHSALGMAYLNQRTLHEAKHHHLIACEMGVPISMMFIAFNKATGAGDTKVDKAKAIQILKKAISLGEPAAKTMFARLLLDKVLVSPNEDPLRLVTEAVAEGDMEAMEIVAELIADDDDTLDDDLFDMLPYTVTPDSTKRPKLVRDAILREFTIAKSDAEKLTAALYGYPSWERLLQAASSSNVPKGPFNEDLAPKLQEARSKELSQVLCSYIDLPQYVADIAVELLAPTAKNGHRPTLTNLEAEAKKKVFRIGSNEMEGLVNRANDTLQSLGFTGNFEAATRLAHPIKPEVWLPMLDQVMDWDIEQIDTDEGADSDCQLVATVTAADDTIFDIHMSRVAFIPGDDADTHVESIMNYLASQKDRAVLVFNSPIIKHTGRRNEDLGILYGGKILEDDKWHDFSLVPEQGFDHARYQRSFSEKSPSDLAKEYSWEGAMAFTSQMTATLRYGDPEEPMGFPGTTDGWGSFVPLELAKAMRAAMRTGRHL